ncbi:hypothetical protein H072_1935 [Dactylellina haptotyla CBS 200.50]|uniref:Extracellular membrane protein CFEM domain-containing protein n=1 Tax=Dactylellina haptotyla (strain CBS 200.50) TaxID=1284197 RepID=S8BX25_DACHA|nr:hypothetical protein H072_1935 [Dactylellina haptotyla CBS 200.50]
MRFSTVFIAAMAALPSTITAFSLYDIDQNFGDVGKTCASQYSIPLMSCGRLPGTCSDACQEQLKSLEKTLQKVCSGSKGPENLLLIALNNGLVGSLCSNGNSGSPVTSAGSSSPTFQAGPGKVATSSVIQLSFSGVSSEGAEAAPTGLIIDTSTPESPASQTVAFPANTYAPTTMQSSTSPTSTSSNSNSGSSNGSPFSSQDDAPSSATAIRASVMGIAIGVLALVANIA